MPKNTNPADVEILISAIPTFIAKYIIAATDSVVKTKEVIPNVLNPVRLANNTGKLRDRK